MNDDKWLFVFFGFMGCVFIGAILGSTAYGVESRLRCIDKLKDRPAVEINLTCGRG